MSNATQSPIPDRKGARKSDRLDAGLGNSVLKRAPGFVISAILHGALLLGATLFYFESTMVVDDSTFLTQIRRPDAKIDPAINTPPPPKKPPDNELSQEQNDPSLVQDPGSHAEAEPDSSSAQDTSGDAGGASPIGVAGLYSAGGSGSGYHSSASRLGGDRSKNKPRSVTDKHLKAALAWLARHQDSNGSWSATQFHKNCGRYGYSEDCSRGEFVGNEQYDVGVTGLALLAFLGGGYGTTSRELVDGSDADPKEPKEILGGDKALTYGDVVKRACKYLTSVQDSSGRIGPEVDRYVYNHLLATLALTEAYGTTRIWLLRQPALKAIRFLIDSRIPGSGWRYGPRSGEADSSVTGLAIAVLRSAEASSLELDASIHEDVRKWFDNVTVMANVPRKAMGGNSWDESRKYLLTGYLSSRDSGRLVSVSGQNEQYCYTPALTAIMAMSSVFAADKTSPRVQGAIETLLAFPPVRWKLEERDSWRKVDFYYWYHATHALSLLLPPEDARWKQWSEAIRAALFETQDLKGFEGHCAQGSWEPIDRWSCEGGRVYVTAIAAMTIEAYYRFPKVMGLARNERPLHVDEE